MLVINADDLPLFMACNGSRLMPRAVPESESDPTLRDEGTAAHYMAQVAFDGSQTLEQLVGQKASNGIFMTDEMAAHCAIYLSSIQPGQMEVETSHSDRNLYTVNGRADHIYHDTREQILYVDDFKYGWGIVEPYMNWTLISHAIGYCTRLGVAPRKVVLTIHQPRPHHRDGKNRSWELTYSELTALAVQLTAALSKPTDVIQSGPHCRKCPANALCPTAQAAGMNAVDCAGIAFTDELSDEALSREVITLKHANKTLENRIKAAEELIKYRLKNASVVPNFALEHQYSNNNWKKNVDAASIKALCGVDISKPATITPAQAKLAGVPDYIIAAMSERTQIGVKLVQIDADARARKLLKEGK